MNKYQKALNKIVVLIEEEYVGTDLLDEKLEPTTVIKELVDKEASHRLMYEGDGYDPVDGELVYDTAICECGRRFEFEYEEHYKYCPNCGRKLDWSECEYE